MVNPDEARLLSQVLDVEEIGDEVKAALFAVKINAVDIDEGCVLYPPAFSWFNHSCTPHVIWRFEDFGCRWGGKTSLSLPMERRMGNS